MLGASAAMVAAGQTKISMSVDGGKPTEGPVGKISHSALETSFEVETLPGLIRYRLAGFDHDWSVRSGEMYFIVRFRNERGDQIGQQSFQVKGRSRGWNGAEETSFLTDRREEVIVPPNARHVTAAISSAGPATAVGTFAIANLKVSTKGTPSRELIGDGATPTEWGKGGTHPSMASSRVLDDGSLLHLIQDSDIRGHADWTTIAGKASQVTPGETLTLQWKEFYCTGMGDAFAVKYGRLPPGSYRFEVEALGYSGEAPGVLAALPVTVMPPWWKSPWYWAGLAVFTAIASYLTGRHLVRKRMRLHAQQARMIADERLRIARDLHDDLGARLSHMALLGSHAMKTAADTGSRQSFGQIASMSRELATSLSETVWMLNSRNDHLESLIDHLCRMVSGMCQPLDIRCRIDAVSPPQDQPVSAEIRHHVSMAVKEAVNNALKHSGCTEVRLKIDLVQGGALDVQVADNGSGLDAAGNDRGNGLENIRGRMETLGGSMEICGPEGGGVVIHLRAPL